MYIYMDTNTNQFLTLHVQGNEYHRTSFPRTKSHKELIRKNYVIVELSNQLQHSITT